MACLFQKPARCFPERLAQPANPPALNEAPLPFLHGHLWSVTILILVIITAVKWKSPSDCNLHFHVEHSLRYLLALFISSFENSLSRSIARFFTGLFGWLFPSRYSLFFPPRFFVYSECLSYFPFDLGMPLKLSLWLLSLLGVAEVVLGETTKYQGRSLPRSSKWGWY